MKKILQTILLTLAVLTAGTSATRADELSELVAAVAASVDTARLAADVRGTAFTSRRQHRRRPEKTPEIDVELLDGILRSMNRQILRERLRQEEDPYMSDPDMFRPTLARGDFYRPVPGIMTSRFGWRPQFQRMHHGVDLSLRVGDTVRAAVSGTVERISYDPNGYGHYVVMSHPDGMETLYGHLQYALVSQGQFVHSGQPLAIGGNTGNSTGPHLHFEARLGGLAVDPTLIFDFYGMGRYLYGQEREKTRMNVPKGPVYTHQTKSLRGDDTYVVRYGDTAESVARQAGITVMRLRQLNMLSENEALPVGRMIKLR